ncbi:MAG: tetratricopeptide repeat protein [Acidobacteriota bacterium]
MRAKPTSVETLGPYRLLETLGEGGMGTVYRAAHAETGAVVALKRVRMGDAGMLLGIRREISALARLSHPGIVRIVDHGAHDGDPWYAMELASGTPLRAHIDGDGTRVETEEPSTVADPYRGEGQLPTLVLDLHDTGASREPPRAERRPCDLAWVIGFVVRLCAPLRYLHGEGIVHRDLTPRNILVRDDGTPLLIDFGLAAASHGPEGRDVLSVDDQVAGTVLYMAPEQSRGEPVDARADLYALGCILYELLTGSPPFRGAIADVFRQHQIVEPLPPSVHVPGVPADLDRLVLRLLAKDPRDRPGYADDVARTLVGGAPGKGGSGAFRPYVYRPALAGRTHELARLSDAVDEVVRGRGGALVVHGESGAGKTRLLLETARIAIQRGALVLSGGCHAGGGPLHGLREVLETVGDRCRARGAAEIERILGPYAAALGLYEPSLPSPGGQRAEAADLPPEEGREHVLYGVTEVLRRVASAIPVTVAIDDAQWADELTIDALDRLARAIAGGSLPILLLTSLRSEDTGELLDRMRSGGAGALAVGRLDPEDVAQIVRDMLALPRAPEELARSLSEHTEGNPLFVAEYVRSAMETGMVTRDREGRWIVPGAHGTAPGLTYEALPLPRTMRELLAVRVDALSREARDLVEAAAVAGRVAPFPLLSGIAAIDGEAFRLAWDELRRRHVVEEHDGASRFIHDKIREIAYDGTDPARRAFLHGAAAGVLESSPAEEAPLHLASIARHWHRAGALHRARARYLDAARAAAARYAHEEAERLYRECLALHDTPCAASVAARRELGERILLVRGRVDDAREELAAALADARATADMAALADGLRALGVLHHQRGEMADATAAYDEALAVARAAGERLLEGRILGALGAVHQDQGRMGEAAALFDTSIRRHEELGSQRGHAAMIGKLGGLYQNLRRFDEAARLCREALAIARQVGDRYQEGRMLGNLAILAMDAGHFDDARAAFEDALAVMRAAGDRRHEAIALGNYGRLVAPRDPEAARSLYGQSLAIHRDIGDRRSEAWVRLNLANLFTDGRAHEEAAPLYAAALDLAREVGDRRCEARVLANQGSVLWDAGRRSEAIPILDAALAIANGIGDTAVAEYVAATRAAPAPSQPRSPEHGPEGSR